MQRGYRINYNLATANYKAYDNDYINRNNNNISNFNLQAEIAEQGLLAEGKSLGSNSNENVEQNTNSDPNNAMNKYQHTGYRIAANANQPGEFDISNEHAARISHHNFDNNYVARFNKKKADFNLLNEDVLEQAIHGALTGGTIGSAKYLLDPESEGKDIGKAGKDIALGTLIGGLSGGVSSIATKKILKSIPKKEEESIGRKIIEGFKGKTNELKSALTKGFRDAKYAVNEAELKTNSLFRNPDIRERTDDPALLNTITDPELYKKGINSPRRLVKLAREIID